MSGVPSPHSSLLLLGDCLEVLPTLDEHSVDVVIADQPYGDTSLDWDVSVTSWLPLVDRVLGSNPASSPEPS